MHRLSLIPGLYPGFPRQGRGHEVNGRMVGGRYGAERDFIGAIVCVDQKHQYQYDDA